MASPTCTLSSTINHRQFDFVPLPTILLRPFFFFTTKNRNLHWHSGAKPICCNLRLHRLHTQFILFNHQLHAIIDCEMPFLLFKSLNHDLSSHKLLQLLCSSLPHLALPCLPVNKFVERTQLTHSPNSLTQLTRPTPTDRPAQYTNCRTHSNIPTNARS